MISVQSVFVRSPRVANLNGEWYSRGDKRSSYSLRPPPPPTTINVLNDDDEEDEDEDSTLEEVGAYHHSSRDGGDVSIGKWKRAF